MRPVVEPDSEDSVPLGTSEEEAADTRAPVIPTIRYRWSPRAFADSPLATPVLRALLEAARWAPSSYNEQPWRFIVARKQQPSRFQRVLSCLSSANRDWAREAPVLMLTVARTRFSHSGEPNRHAFHDVGLAMGNLLAQATAMNVAGHQMAGIRPKHARDVFRAPPNFEVVAGVALGYVGDPDELGEDQRQSELTERSRKPLAELVFGDTWGQSDETVVGRG